MAWIRQLPSGLWAATVYSPAGRITESHELRGVIAEWARKLESDIDRGEFLDPRLAQHTVDEVWQRFGGSRRLERASKLRDASIYKNHVRPRWGRIPVGAVLKPDVQEWINKLEEQMKKDEIGGWTIIAALNVLKAVMELAIDAKWLRHNPARRVRPPVAPQHEDRVLDADEEDLLLERLDELFPGRRDGRLFVETLLDTGGRWEEVAAVRREAVDLKRDIIALGPVVERNGTIREYPKGARSRHAAGFRDAPIGRDLMRRLRPVVLATAPGAVVFASPQGKILSYSNWYRRVWLPALRGPYTGPPPERRPGQSGPLRTPLGPYLLADPQPTPHDCRHTFGTRLAEAGLEQHDRMALMGHKDERSARRYVHSSDARHDRARAALARARGKPVEDRNSQTTHDVGR